MRFMGKILRTLTISALVSMVSSSVVQSYAAETAYQSQPFDYRMMRFLAWAPTQAAKNSIDCSSYNVNCKQVGEAGALGGVNNEAEGLKATGVSPEILKAEGAAQLILGMITTVSDAEFPTLTSVIESNCPGVLAHVIETLPPDINKLPEKNQISQLDKSSSPCMALFNTLNKKLKSRGAWANSLSLPTLNTAYSKTAGLQPIIAPATSAAGMTGNGSSARTSQ
jgi:hypothetical protein